MAARVSSGATPRRSAATRRRNGAGKNRSSAQITERVGTAGSASSGHGALYAASDSPRALLSASSAKAEGTSW